MNLIILTDDDQTADGHYRLSDHRAEHIRTVLKLSVGDNIEVGLVDGGAGSARIKSVEKNEIIVACETLVISPPPSPIVDIICALPRPQTLRKLLSTIATMGVRRLYLIRANRVEKSYFHSPLLTPHRYRRYLLEGLSQGKLTRMPQVHIHNRFRTFLEDDLPAYEKQESDSPLRLVADGDATILLSDQYDGAAGRLLLAFGPEGGWVPFEIEQFEKAGFCIIRLTRTVLRVETAVTAALAQIELLRLKSTAP
ncbi:MAG: 16S rRNA (uracil(1498)-N(3))-methyltransferase [Candidatus Zixiibacteriota bacterium]